MKPGKLKHYINSIDLQNHKRTEAILQRVVSQYLSDVNEPYKHRYELQNFNSKEIERMLTMFENSRSGIRKLSLLLISLVLMNPQSKIFFLEKCGLSLVTGKTFLTRLKYVSNFASSKTIAFRHMRNIMGELKQHPVLSPKVLFWFIPLEISERVISDLFIPRIRTFYISDIKVFSNVVDLSYIPDPVFNLCGVEFSKMDQQAKKMAIRAPKQNMQPFSHSAISHVRKSNRPSHIETKSRGSKNYFQNSTRSTIIKTNRDYSKSSANQPGQKEYRHSQIKMQRPSGRVKAKGISGWGNHRKNGYENKSGMPLKSEIKMRGKEIRRHTMMGQTGNHFGRTSKISTKNGSYKIKSPYRNTKKKNFQINNGGISSMHEVLGTGQITRHNDLFNSGIYNKKKGRSTYGKLHLKNSRKSAKS